LRISVVLLLVVIISGCGGRVGLTPYLHTNTNEFRLYPLDVKKPAITEEEIVDDAEDGAVTTDKDGTEDKDAASN